MSSRTFVNVVAALSGQSLQDDINSWIDGHEENGWTLRDVKISTVKDELDDIWIYAVLIFNVPDEEEK